MSQVPAERERPDRTRQSVGGDGEPDEQADAPRRGGSHREPRDRDGAHPVAERGDAEAREQSPCATIPQQRSIRLQDQSGTST
jgi:hypothetical protein